MKNFIKKLLTKKFIIIVIILVAVSVYLKYFYSSGNTQSVQYQTATVEKGMLIVTVSGSGQVSTSETEDVKPKASGNLLSIDVKNGQEVKAGDIIAQIDAGDAEKTIRDAQLGLQSARLALQKLQQKTDAYTILQAKNSLTQAKYDLEKLKITQEINSQKATQTKQNSQDNLSKSYEDGFNSVANIFLDLPSIMTGLDNILYDNTIVKNSQNISAYYNMIAVITNNSNDEEMSKAIELFTKNAENTYKTARTAYDKNFESYKNITRSSPKEDIEKLIDETTETVKSASEAIKSASNLLDFVTDFLSKKNYEINPLMQTYQTTLTNYTGLTSSHITDILSIKKTIIDSKQAISNADLDLKQMEQNNPIDIKIAEQSIAEKQANLNDLYEGADQLDIESQQLTIKGKENALLDAQENLGDYSVRAPFDGIIASISAKERDPVSSSTVIATQITKSKIAEIPLNEVDMARVKIGQSATLAFDAVSDLSITGKVADMDTIGTVTQGVVSYNVKIAFDVQDERVKPGMSLSATIITDSKSDALIVPNSAINRDTDGSAYVQIMKNGVPVKQPVEVGLTNDTMTEITSGLNEGDQIVSQTIKSGNSTSSAAQTQQGGGLRIPGLGGFGH